MITKLFQLAPIETEMTQEEVYAETEQVLDAIERLTWGGFLLILIGL